jgi:hypothetical protein
VVKRNSNTTNKRRVKLTYKNHELFSLNGIQGEIETPLESSQGTIPGERALKALLTAYNHESIAFSGTTNVAIPSTPRPAQVIFADI